MKSILIDSDIQIDDITILQRTVVRYPVTDDLIDRSTQRLREFVVIQRRGIGVVLYYEVVNHLVDIVRRHSCLHHRMTDI